MHMTKYKKCESCRRELPIEHYPVDRSKKSGVARRCKDCNTYRAKRDYRTRAPKFASVHTDPLIQYPLRDQNQMMIDGLSDDFKGKLWVTHVPTRETKRMDLIMSSGRIEVYFLKDDSGIDIWDTLDSTVKEVFHDYLWSQEIRIHHTEECDI